MIKRFTPLPALGDFVWCKFPEVMGKPGPKSRPALVIGLFEEDHKVRVCYGTSQKTSQLHRGEIALDPQDDGFSISGLGARTKFNVTDYVDLPFTSEWFGEHKGMLLSSPLPKMGTLHSSYMQEITRALSL